MKLVGFNFTKIHAEKSSEQPKEIKINTSVNILEITELKSDFLKSKEDMIGIKFNYGIDYSPNFAKIELSGVIIISVDSKESKEVLRQWKDKKVPDNFKLAIFNIILSKANIKAIQLEDEFNLPIHINMPSLRPTTEKKKE